MRVRLEARRTVLGIPVESLWVMTAPLEHVEDHMVQIALEQVANGRRVIMKQVDPHHFRIDVASLRSLHAV